MYIVRELTTLSYQTLWCQTHAGFRHWNTSRRYSIGNSPNLCFEYHLYSFIFKREFDVENRIISNGSLKGNMKKKGGKKHKTNILFENLVIFSAPMMMI